MADTPHVQYEVTHQSKGMEPDGHGSFVPTFTVHYKTADGVESHIKMPATHYTARNVHEAIQHEATTIAQVAALGQGAPPPHPQT